MNCIVAIYRLKLVILLKPRVLNILFFICVIDMTPFDISQKLSHSISPNIHLQTRKHSFPVFVLAFGQRYWVGNMYKRCYFRTYWSYWRRTEPIGSKRWLTGQSARENHNLYETNSLFFVHYEGILLNLPTNLYEIVLHHHIRYHSHLEKEFNSSEKGNN